MALTLSAVPQPAEAGAACNELDLSSPCISSSDLNANLILGGSASNGRLRARKANGQTGVELSASTANLTNLFSNSANNSNGLVKAWAQINIDGTIAACWRCNSNPAETNWLDIGVYEVDFTPLATDISGRPRLATIDVHFPFAVAPGSIELGDRSGDSSSVYVTTEDTEGLPSDRPFVLIIY